MKSLTRLSVSGLFAVALAPPVFASDGAGPGDEKRGEPLAVAPKVDCMPAQPGMPANCLTQEDDVITGEVEEIDYVTGTLVLNHRGARFTLHFPPAAIVDVRKGDTVAIPMTEEPPP